MTPRERILAAIDHREPDRLPVDLGGMDSTGIHAAAYNRLKDYLGIRTGETRIIDPYQQVVLVEAEVLEAVGGCVLPVTPMPGRWRETVLYDGTTALVPERWTEREAGDGSREALGTDGTVIARMPSGGMYYEPVNPPYARAGTCGDIEKNPEPIENFDLPGFADETVEELGRRAEKLRRTTDKALMGNFCAHVFAAGQLLRGFETFMMDLVLRPEIAECIMSRLVDAYIDRLGTYAAAVGPHVDVINVNDDLGTQEAPMVSPGMYRSLIKPHHERLYRAIHEMTEAALFLHTDGNVYPLIPDLIDAGVDILNPVQYTARQMDAGALKREFGDRLTFWGGGCDTQKVLAGGTPEEVREEVRKQAETLKPGGGFVFNQVHNIQPDVPPENIMAMFEAAREHGSY
ncbi:MAG: methyltransferase [Planctomycetes bacterium]|nr:methyltransferase [Planctomycetota bacterium]